MVCGGSVSAEWILIRNFGTLLFFSMKKSVLFLLFVAVVLMANGRAVKDFNVQSPDGLLQVKVEVGKAVNYSLTYRGAPILSSSEVSLTLADGKVWGKGVKLRKAVLHEVDETIPSPFYKKSEVSDHYQELVLVFSGYRLLFRAYDEGMAYRFESTSADSLIVQSEQATFRFPEDFTTYTPYANAIGTLSEQLGNSFESCYVHLPLSRLDTGRLAFLPLIVEADRGVKVAITESDLENYPGMFLHNADGGLQLTGVFAEYPHTVQKGGPSGTDVKQYVNSRYPWLTKAFPHQRFPWRVVCVAENEAQLLANDMVYRLAEAPRFQDVSWVRPGKVAWEWWNSFGVFNVPFTVGRNTDTYKYYVDFASRNKIEYVILDGGWSVGADLLQVQPDIDLPELLRYAKERQVGIILWAGFWHIDKNMEEVFRHYSEMGVKGFKLDFVDRDDALAVNFHYRAAAIAAKYHLLLDFHGTYKPTGISRTYPNVLNFEGVNGQEQNRWSTMAQYNQVQYDVEMPFARMLAGPVDYTQGAMLNATRAEYRMSSVEPMSQGTRCHQLAEYVVFFSPLNMLCDGPTRYEREPECTSFIAQVPTVWDETLPLQSEIGEYVAVARRKGAVWYVGVVNNWTPRTLKLSLRDIGGVYQAEAFVDGPNAALYGQDYLKRLMEVDTSKLLTIELAPGGGFAMRLTK